MAWGVKKDSNSAELKSIENSLKQTENAKKEMIYQLGEIFYDANRDNEGIDDIYKDKVDTIKKLEYNLNVWNNRKLKSQGLRICDNCGNPLPYDSSFCNKCGCKLQPVQEEPVII
ncbi:MAG: hypothetical protein K5776_01345 [Lachnospiraceae bacterium]|nr:hypothetical protein [Lachnospiraceae bacterium]